MSNLKLIDAYLDGKVVKCYPLATFLYEYGSIKTIKHKFLFFKWCENKLIDYRAKSVVCYIPYKHREKEIQIIPQENVYGNIDDYSKDWIKVDSYISPYNEEPKGEMKVKDFFGESFIFENNEFMSYLVCNETWKCLDILYKEKHELISLSFDEYNENSIFVKYESHCSNCIEIQYCKNSRYENANIDFEKEDSLYFDYDYIDEFIEKYGKIITNGKYQNGQEGSIDFNGLNFFNKEKTITIIKELENNCETQTKILVSWLKKSLEYNGFYILGI